MALRATVHGAVFSAGDFGGDCLVRVSEPWGHGDVIFFGSFVLHLFLKSDFYLFVFQHPLVKKKPWRKSINLREGMVWQFQKK